MLTSFGIHKSRAIAPLTSLGIGGDAEFYAEPVVVEELLDVLAWAYSSGMACRLVGRGSNILAETAGHPGLTVCTRRLNVMSVHDVDREFVAPAGVPLPQLATKAGALGWDGFDFLIGIPGTVGGAIVMNAGIAGPGGPAFESLVRSVLIFDPVRRTTEERAQKDLAFGYRYSALHENKQVVLSATLRASGSLEPHEARLRQSELKMKRRRTQPVGKRTCGSLFKQPSGNRGAWWYLEQVGAKAMSSGDLRVSPVHANWIENIGRATSEDVRSLIARLQDRVYASFGVALEPELHFLSNRDLW